MLYMKRKSLKYWEGKNAHLLKHTTLWFPYETLMSSLTPTPVTQRSAHIPIPPRYRLPHQRAPFKSGETKGMEGDHSELSHPMARGNNLTPHATLRHHLRRLLAKQSAGSRFQEPFDKELSVSLILKRMSPSVQPHSCGVTRWASKNIWDSQH